MCCSEHFVSAACTLVVPKVHLSPQGVQGVDAFVSTGRYHSSWRSSVFACMQAVVHVCSICSAAQPNAANSRHASKVVSGMRRYAVLVLGGAAMFSFAASLAAVCHCVWFGMHESNILCICVQSALQLNPMHHTAGLQSRCCPSCAGMQC